MLQVKHLTISHKKDLTVLVDDLSFVLGPGHRAAIIGEEGNGKSTVLKLLYDPSLVEDYADWSGELIDHGCHKGYLDQELPPEVLKLTVLDYCRSTPAFEDADPREIARIAGQLGLDTEHFYDWRPMSTLSGGERVKLRLAMLLLAQPDLLLLDEPSNDLDVDTVAWLEQFLLSCPIPVLYVSHDQLLLTRTANVVIHLERLRRRTTSRCTVANLDYASYIARRQATFAQQEQISRKEHAEYQAKMETYRKIRDKVNHQQASISRQDPHGGRLLKKKMHTVLSLGRRFQREAEQMTPMPEWEEAIMASFDPKRAALPEGKVVLRLDLPLLTAGDRILSRDIHLWVTGPEKIGIVGPNGAGKSTLLKLLADQLLERKDIAASYMPQNYFEQLPRGLTPVEILAPSGRKEDITRARTLLGSMKYQANEMDHEAASLSGGQCAKLLFLSMVLNGSNVLILDEPTRNFSPLSAPVIRHVLAQFPGVILSVSHDRQYLSEVCQRVLKLTPNGLEEVHF